MVWIHLSKTAEESELGKKNLMIINYVWKIITKWWGVVVIVLHCTEWIEARSINSIHTCHVALENHSVVEEDGSSACRPVRGGCSVVDVLSSFPSWSLVSFGYKLSPAAAFSWAAIKVRNREFSRSTLNNIRQLKRAHVITNGTHKFSICSWLGYSAAFKNHDSFCSRNSR